MQTDIHNIKPRVLIVDNNERTRRTLERMTTLWGYEPVVAEGLGEALLENAKHLATKQRVQFALVDMRLLDDLDDEDESGIDLVPHLAPARCLVISAGGSPRTAQLSNDYGAAFIRKGDDPEALKTRLDNYAQSRSAQKRALPIGPPEILHSSLNTLEKYLPPPYQDQILDTLSLLFPRATSLRLEHLNQNPQGATSSGAPRPKSVILRVVEDDRQPVIVKLARKHKILQESQNYEKFIDGRLVGNYRPIMLNSIALWDLGGIKIMNVGSKARPFSQILKQESVKNIRLCLERFLGAVWADLYKKAEPLENQSLFGLYCNVWGTEWVERADKLNHFDPQMAMGKDRWQALNAPHPIHWFFEKVAGNSATDISRLSRTYTAITHGDLHGDNLLVDEQYNAWVIDFERSGVGHILQDFIELESDIINRLHCGPENISNFSMLCLSIARPKTLGAQPANLPDLPDPEMRKALQVISAIRRLAAKHTPISDAREYLLGLFFNTVFRATLIAEDHIACQRRALMLASILAHRLDHWNEPWPPPTWGNIPTTQGA